MNLDRMWRIEIDIKKDPPTVPDFWECDCLGEGKNYIHHQSKGYCANCGCVGCNSPESNPADLWHMGVLPPRFNGFRLTGGGDSRRRLDAFKDRENLYELLNSGTVKAFIILGDKKVG